MKRVTLEIDLKENEIFEKEVEEAIRAKTREVVRGEYERIIQEEASKEFKRIFDANTYGYRDQLKDAVKDAAAKSIKRTIAEQDIAGLTKEKIEEIVTYKVQYYSDIVEQKCTEVLQNRITALVEEKLKTFLS